MQPRDRVLASIERKPFDRLPIKHLAVREIDALLTAHFRTRDYDELLDILGHDLREVHAGYRGPDLGDLMSEHGILTDGVWGSYLEAQRPGVSYPLASITSPAELKRFQFAQVDWFDFTTLGPQCVQYQDYARIYGYCEFDFINGLSRLRSNQQVLMDIGSRDPVYLELVQRRFEFDYEYLQKGLTAGQGQIELVHLGDDLGTQQGLLLSPRSFAEVFGDKYRAAIDLIHDHGARAMMHVCGSVAGMIPTLIDLGLDVLDVVQTNAAGMDIVTLQRRFGRDISFAGTMCVQQVIPFGTRPQVRAEVQKRLELFRDGGLIIGPSHQLQVDSPLENILEMYRAAGGLRER
jgi:uroporphyrinogen decarboxylase